MKKLLVLGLFSSLLSAAEIAPASFSRSLDYAQVEHVDAIQSKDGSWCFETKVRHNDQSWEHYANAWQVTDLQGNLLAERKLAHPHDHEQPFTRRQCNIIIPADMNNVMVQAKCNQHGFWGKTVLLDMSVESGKDFTVKPNRYLF